jgi:hypothetical protein
MTALLKPMELVSAISSQLKALCEANYAASILKQMWGFVCQCMGKFALQRQICSGKHTMNLQKWRATIRI